MDYEFNQFILYICNIQKKIFHLILLNAIEAER